METLFLLEPLIHQTVPLDALSSMSAIDPATVAVFAVETGVKIGTWLAS